MQYDYNVYFLDPIEKHCHRFVKGVDCLTALEAFTKDYHEEYQTSEAPHVLAIRRASFVIGRSNKESDNRSDAE